MAQEGFKRKLAAVLSADVKEYSRLMREDETATIRTLTAYREVMTTLIKQHHGRVVDTVGDNLLAEFASVVDGVQGAVAIQKEIKSRNAQLPESRKMLFRIGINLGDLVVEGDRIYGDGVNIAARVEGLSDAGGISVSGNVYDQIKNKLPFSFEYTGEHEVKNIKDPVSVYKVIMRSEASDLDERKGFELTNKPSVAVLPFVNISGDPEQEYFSDGMTEDIITDLSKISGLFVIARNSSFTYKGKPVKAQKVSQELGVRYILEGSVRKVKNRVRISAQLVDAVSGGHLWAERYDRELVDIFALQDEVTKKIVEALEVRLTEMEQKYLGRIPTDNLEAYDCFLRGRAYIERSTKEANERARQLFEKAIKLDSKYAMAYVALGVTYWTDWTLQWSQNPQIIERAIELMEKAVAMNASSPEAHMTLAFIYLLKKQHEQAIVESDKAIDLDPNNLITIYSGL